MIGCVRLVVIVLLTFSRMAESEQNRIRRNVNNLLEQSYVNNRNSYSRDSTIRIEGLQLKEGEAIKVIEETETITGVNTVLAVVDNVDSGTCDVTLDSQENAVKLLHGIEINDVEYNVSSIFSDTIVVSFMKLPSYIEDEDIISKLQANGIKLVSPVHRRAIPGAHVFVNLDLWHCHGLWDLTLKFSKGDHIGT